MPSCYGAPRPARVWLDRGRTNGPPCAQRAYGATTGRRVARGKPRHLGARRRPGEGAWPKGGARPQVEGRQARDLHDLLQNFVLKCIK
jgi:hypothetical protein